MSENLTLDDIDNLLYKIEDDITNERLELTAENRRLREYIVKIKDVTECTCRLMVFKCANCIATKALQHDGS